MDSWYSWGLVAGAVVFSAAIAGCGGATKTVTVGAAVARSTTTAAVPATSEARPTPSGPTKAQAAKEYSPEIAALIAESNTFTGGVAGAPTAGEKSYVAAIAKAEGEFRALAEEYAPARADLLAEVKALYKAEADVQSDEGDDTAALETIVVQQARDFTAVTADDYAVRADLGLPRARS